MTTTPDWEHGNCHAQPHLTHLFFSDKQVEQDQARALCWDCPIVEDCLVHAIETNEKFGIWGGLLPAERKRLRS